MILVDTSVLIDYLKGRQNAKAQMLDDLLRLEIPFGIAAYTYQEVLQGARDEKEFQALDEYLSSQTMLHLESNAASHRQAALMYFRLRRAGLTIRGTIDILIALTAIQHGAPLLHNDRDFDAMAKCLPELRIYPA